jgi:hypothetical protein
MQETPKCSILAIAPYRILPATGGGHAAILHLHNYLGKLCSDQLVSTKDNDNAHAYGFDMHRMFATNPGRYLPYANRQELVGLGRKYDVKSIICEHPYMAITANAVAKKLKVPWYLRAHNIESERFRSLGKVWWGMLAKYEQWAMQKAKGTFFLTQEDADWAVGNYGIESNKCYFLPFGCILNKRPEGKEEARKALAELWNIDAGKKWIYFLGSLDYKPNEEAVQHIVNEITPLLREQLDGYQILIGGKGLNHHLQEQIRVYSDIQYVGFIPDLHDFLNACDVMINPVMKGGGVKTKAVEALGYNKIVVSSQSGAAGLIPSVCGENLHITADEDWSGFCGKIVQATKQTTNIPDVFYETYYWGNIAQKAIDIMQRNAGY